MCNECNMTVVTEPQNAISGEEAELYDSEQGSDVTFVAGLDSDTWRFPGHRAVLAAANQVFRAMLCGPLSNGEDVIYVRDVDKRAFGQLMRYLYGQPASLPSVATARATLEAAHKYICPGLVRECVSYLDLNLSSTTVLEIFQDLRFFCSRVPPPGVPTAPPLYAIDNSYNESRAEETMTETCDSLLHNCLIFIDDNADEVLQQERIEELSYDDMSIIAQRDSIYVTSEMELFHALSRWCKSECKRNKKELTSANRRQVLGQLSYTVRYLLMTENEFTAGPQASELLDLTECRMILARMRNDKAIKFSLEQEMMLQRFSTPRMINFQMQPVPLSERSEKKRLVLKDLENTETIESNKKKKKKKKSKKKSLCCVKQQVDKVDGKLDEKKSECSCSCFGESLLRAFVCIFD
ncbi:BTB/POZ domain-containing protein axundead [Arctopsyche grandis]|uniref:BTB/POZ domain-containing protein axundead n=1 Tax=Arctopsyche grandis TaxID=121162 RepID=UPI00406D7806